MLKSIKPFLVLVLLPFTFLACDPANQYKTELAEIDSYLNRVDSLETLFDGIKFDSLRYMVDHVKENEKLITELYSPDTLDANFGRQMNDSKSIRKTLTDLDRYESTLGEELNAVKHQLQDLKDDILAGLYSDDQIHEYIDIEKAALARVDETFSEFYVTQIEETKLYYEVVPQVDAFIEKLKANSDTLQ